MTSESRRWQRCRRGSLRFVQYIVLLPSPPGSWGQYVRGLLGLETDSALPNLHYMSLSLYTPLLLFSQNLLQTAFYLTDKQLRCMISVNSP
jgi:hypothetical protein